MGREEWQVQKDLQLDVVSLFIEWGKQLSSYFRYRSEQISQCVSVVGTHKYGIEKEKREPPWEYTRSGGIWVKYS